MTKAPSLSFFHLAIVSVSLTAVLSHRDVRGQILNGDFSAGHTNFTSDYTFEPISAQIPGYYVIARDSQSANPNYPKFGDHTTGTGNMLLADGHTNANKTVWSQTVPVATNTSYAFSAWAATSGSGSPAVLRFLVNSNQLGSDFPLSGNPGVWQRFVAVWNSGSNTNATLSILDTNLVYVGNDFALDDLAFYSLTNQTPSVTIHPAVEVGWPSQTGIYYQLQYTTALNSNEWINAGPPMGSGSASSNINIYQFDTTRGQPQKFYRVMTIY